MLLAKVAPSDIKAPTAATLGYIPDGVAGTRATLQKMRLMVLASKLHPEIINLAKRIVAPVRARNWAGEARAVQRWIQDNVRYTRDVRDVETITAPLNLLAVRSGDCDDQATLAAALLEAIGHSTRLVAAGRQKNQFSHVYVETRIGPHWVPLETTRRWELGTRPPLPEKMAVHV